MNDGGRPHLRAALGVFVVALALRALHLVAMQQSPFWGVELGDAHRYLEWARTLAAGDWFGSAVFYQAPLYPYVLGAIVALGGSVATVLAVQAVLGSVACALLALAGEQWFDRAAGIAAGLLLACYGPAIFFDGIVQKSTLDGVLIAGLLLALARVTSGRALAGGVLLGLLALTRENALGLAPLVLAWVASRRWVAAVAFAAGLVLPLAPVAARNAALSGEIHLTTSQLGPNFWIGNHAGASGLYEPLVYGRGDALVEQDDARRIARKALGGEPTDGEVSSWWLQRALADIAAAPDAWARLLAHKTVLTWNATEWADTEDPYTAAEFSPVLRATLATLGFGVLAALGGVGTALAWPRRREVWLLPAWLATYSVLTVSFYVFARYRYPLVPVLAILGGFAVAEATRAAPIRRVQALVAFAVLLVLFNLPLGDRDAMRGTTWTNLGIDRAAHGDPAGARAAYERALAHDPGSVRAMTNLAAMELANDPRAALALLEGALSRAPSSATVWNSRGHALAAAGRDDDALQSFTRATDLDPDEPGAWIDLGLAQYRRGDSGAAEAAFRRALDAQPEHPQALVNLGVLLAERGNLREAERLFERAAHAGAGPDAEENLARVRASMAAAP